MLLNSRQYSRHASQNTHTALSLSTIHFFFFIFWFNYILFDWKKPFDLYRSYTAKSKVWCGKYILLMFMSIAAAIWYGYSRAIEEYLYFPWDFTKKKKKWKKVKKD